MRKAFKYCINPDTTTEKTLFWTLTRCRELYNAALQERRDAWQKCGVSVGYFAQKRDLPEIKSALRPEYQSIASHVLQNVLLRLDKAFQAFFRRVKAGETPGYPRFQGRNRYNSFTYPDSKGWKLDVEERGKKLVGILHLAKIGSARVRLHRPIEGTIKTVTIKYEVDEWYIVFSCDCAEPEKLPVSYEDIGIDLGVSHLATLSSGEFIEHPRYYWKARLVLERRQQALARKKKGSHRRERSRREVAKAHRYIRRQRRDAHFKAAKRLVDRFQTIVFEDIATANLTRKPEPKPDGQGGYLPNGASAKAGLNQSILDAGWASFVSICTAKAAWAGRCVVLVDPRYTSQTCSQCGQIRKKDLSERWHSCDCGAELDRDINAAINILERGRRQQRATVVEAPIF